MNIERLRVAADKYFERGKWQKALNAYLTLSELEPTNVRIRLRIAENLMRLQKPDEARMIFRDVADFYSRDGQLHKAISLHHRLLEIDRNDREIQTRLAELYQRHGSQAMRDLPANPEHLAEDLKKICSDEISEEWTKLTQRLEQQEMRKDFKMVLEILLLRWELNPMDIENRTRIAKTLVQLDRQEEALEIYHHSFLATIKAAHILKALYLFATCQEMAKIHPFSKGGEMLKRLALVCSNRTVEANPKTAQPSLFPTALFQKQRTATMDQKVQDILLQGYDLEKIRPIEIFEQLSRPTCEQFLAHLKPRELKKDEDLFQPGTFAEHLFLLTHGTIAAFPENNPANTAIVQEGSYLDIETFLKEGKYPVTARAMEDVEVLVLTRADCDRLQKHFPDFSKAIDRLFVDHVIQGAMPQHPLFDGLSQEEMVLLAPQWQVETFEPKALRIQLGDPVRKVMFLRSGLLETRMPQDKTPLTQMSSGRFFLEHEANFGLNAPCIFENPTRVVLHCLPVENIPISIRNKMSSNSQAKSQLIQRLGI